MDFNQRLLKMPGYRSAEYILVLDTPTALQEKIKKIKRFIYEEYGAGVLLNKKPVITLTRFFSLQMREEKIINHFKIAGMAMPPFRITLKDYMGIADQSVSIPVTSKTPLQMLMKDIKSAKRLISASDKKPFFNTDFSIPLAVKLTPLQYKNLWKEFSHRHFTGHFIADSMLLLKRREGDKHYEIAARFAFQNLPVSVRQGELFG